MDSFESEAGTDANVDIVQPFQIDGLAARGRLVRLGGAVDQALAARDYPKPVAELLAETMALAATLSSLLKYDGIFTLQAEGDGPIRLLMADVTSAGDIRACAQFDADRVSQRITEPGDSVPHFMGAGHLAFTVDQGPDTERYQGITELTGATMSGCAHTYFRQSEQMETAVVLMARTADTAAHAGSLMIQRLPTSAAEDEDAWRRAVALMSSVKKGELLNPDLTPGELLYRLFHEDGVRLFEPRRLNHVCRCSRERVIRTLASFPRTEISDLADDGEISVSCEFCGARYGFSEPELDLLFEAG